MSADYAWQDQAWSRPGWEYYQIYQLHPLRFSDRNTTLTPLERITEELDGDGSDDYLKELGVTAIQLLPVNEFAGDIGWGYNPSFFYAVEFRLRHARPAQAAGRHGASERRRGRSRSGLQPRRQQRQHPVADRPGRHRPWHLL